MYRLTRLPQRVLRSRSGAPLRPLSTSTARCSPSPTQVLGSSTTATQPHPSVPSESYHPSTSSVFTPLDTFLPRHVGPRSSDVDQMLEVLGYSSMDEFVNATIPKNVRVDELSDADDGHGLRPWSELELRRRAEEVAAMNKGMKSYIGMG